MYIKNLVDNSYVLQKISRKWHQLFRTYALFSFVNRYGACPTCGGYGDIMGIDPELVIPKISSVYEDCIAPWRGQKLKNINNFG